MTIRANLVKEFANMSEKVAEVFPKADYVLTFEFPKDKEPEIRFYFKKDMKGVTTNLSGKSKAVGDEKLQPARDEILQLVAPDATVSHHRSAPNWFWLALELSTVPENKNR